MTSAVLESQLLGFPWPTSDPFLFCVHHVDAYPRGNAKLGPIASLDGRRLGNDFEPSRSFRMYHGREVPGFPRHPHRGFETVTLVRQGFVDHSDSLGGAARYGPGDVQWMTAGEGIVHAEMFPLLSPEQPNPLELFQIWLNLPSSSKLTAPHIRMFWNPQVPHWEAGHGATATIVAGELGGVRALAPPPDSWAARSDADVAIWSIHLAAGGRCTLPPARNPSSLRTAYFFRGATLTAGGARFDSHMALRVRPDLPLALGASDGECDVLLLQGRPIGEPVAHYGPFVMNRTEEIDKAFEDFGRTQFGGWPWPSDGPVHPRQQGRFARYSDGRVESPESPDRNTR